jgi:hypothetical protein
MREHIVIFPDLNSIRIAFGLLFPALVLGMMMSPMEAKAEDPTAVATATNVTTPGSASYSFSVHYLDDGQVAANTLDDNDVRVSGPGGFDNAAALDHIMIVGEADVFGTYRLSLPGVVGIPATTAHTKWSCRRIKFSILSTTPFNRARSAVLQLT